MGFGNKDIACVKQKMVIGEEGIYGIRVGWSWHSGNGVGQVECLRTQLILDSQSLNFLNQSDHLLDEGS